MPKLRASSTHEGTNNHCDAGERSFAQSAASGDEDCGEQCRRKVDGMTCCKCAIDQVILPGEADGNTMAENNGCIIGISDIKPNEEEPDLCEEKEGDFTPYLITSEYDTDSDDMDWEDEGSEASSYDSDFDFDSEATEDDD